MWTAASALVCALTILNRSEASFPRIEILDVAPAYVSVGTEAFVRHSTNTIYLIASARVMHDAAGSHRGECGDRFAVKKLASILIHEEWHLKNGPDERGAYERQLTALTELGAGPGTGVYYEVNRSMQYVLAARRRGDVLVLAQR
jgi:hypothetical protein